MPAEPFGGLQALVIDLVRAQRQAGKKVELVLLGPSRRVEARSRTAGIEPIVLRGSKLFRMIALRRHLKRLGPAILHSHCEPVWTTALLAARSKRWIVHLHVYALQKSLRDRMGNLIRRLYARRFIGITHSIAKSFIDSALIPAERSAVVYNGLDLTTVPTAGCSRAAGALFTVAFVGRAVREKGLFDFIETAALLRDEPQLRFVIAGEGGDLAEAKALIAARNLDERIEVTGFVEDTASLWREVDMLLMLSIREPFGLVILEAISFGVAVLGYEVASGGSEIMAQIPGCHMVPAFSISDLAAAIRGALSDRETARAEIEAGRVIVAERFSLERMEKGIAREYAHLL